MISANQRASTPDLLRSFGLLALLGACNQARSQQAPATASPHPPLIVAQQALMSRKPDLNSPAVKIWNMQQTDTLRVNLVEMRGKLPRHTHPDAAHSLLLLEGSVRVEIGDSITVMNKGDYVSIPAGVVHGYTTITPTALLVSADAPFYDPKKTVYERERPAR
jgi:quercetin dioxygenase-like cupin family protein